MRVFNQVVKGFEAVVKLSETEEKKLVSRIKSVGEIKSFLAECSKIEEEVKTAAGAEANQVITAMDFKAKQLALLFGEAEQWFLDTFSPADLQAFWLEAMGELVTGKQGASS